MKKILASIAMLFGLMQLTACGVPVRSDEVGVMVNDMGNNAGVQEAELRTGRHWPAIGSYIITFPTRLQTEVWSGENGSGGNPIVFSNGEGVKTAMGVSLQLRVDPTKASDLVQRYRQGFPEIVDGTVRMKIQGAFNNIGNQYTSEQLSTGKAPELLNRVFQTVREPLAKEGVILENMEMINSVWLPDNIMESINRNAKAKQDAQAAESQKAVVQAQADQRIIEAKARAEALAIEGEALNKNPQVSKLREIEKWNGICPLNSTSCVVGADAKVLVQ